MANGIDTDLNGQPWVIKFHSGGGTALPATILGVQNGTNLALPFLPKRVVWVSANASAGDTVIAQDAPGFGGTATPRDIFRFNATGADYMPPQEWKRSEHEGGYMGFVITQFDSGELLIYN